MEFFAYAESTHVASKPQNQRLAQIIILILTTSVFFFGHLQITTAQAVHIPDPSLRAVIEAALGKEAGEDITQADMASLKALEAFWIKVSLARRGCSWENGYAERLIRTLKEEEVHLNDYDNISEVQARIGYFIQ